MPTKKMLIDATHPEETRVAVVDGNRLVDYDVEVASRRQLKGNIYLAKVTRVEPSLQAAFVDYGGNRHGFLAFNEIHPDYYQIPVADREAILAEQAAAEEEAGAVEEPQEGGLAETAVDADEEEAEPRRPRISTRRYKIQEVIKRRQIMLVQVTKEERGTKGAALTTYLSLAGRYCVLMPNTTRGGGVSRKITSIADRKRLKNLLGDLGIPAGMAVILRTAGAERSKAEIKRDYDYLIRLWNNIRELTLKSMAPMLVYEEGSLIKRSIRDLYDRDIAEILIEGDAAYRMAKDFMKLLIPSHARRVKPYEDRKRPLLLGSNVESELEKMHQPAVQLRSGGSIVINPTEALVAIDVNSGRSTRERHIEETALRTNLEACDEIARQLRLRDLAGLIVIDFIDMEHARNQGQVERRLKEAMKTDRARVQIGRISPFGLLELSRQRLRPSLLETSYEPCRFCQGTGARRSTESLALAVLRRIESEAINHRLAEIGVTLPTPVALYLLNQKRRTLLDVEGRYGIVIAVSSNDAVMAPEYQVKAAEEAEAGGEEPAEAPQPEAERAAAAEAGGEEPAEAGKRSRRRRPRKRKRSEEELPAAEPLAPGIEPQEEMAAEAPGGAEVSIADRGEQPEDDDKGAKKRRRRGKRGGRRRIRRTAEVEAAQELSLPLETPQEGPLDAAATSSLDTAPAGSEAADSSPGAEDPAAVEAPEIPQQEAAAKKPPRRSRRKKAAPESVVEGAAVMPEMADTGTVSVDEARPVIDRPSGDAGLPGTDDRPQVATASEPQEVRRTEEAGAGDDRAGAEENVVPGHTIVINVGAQDQGDSPDERRRGWWQRLMG